MLSHLGRLSLPKPYIKTAYAYSNCERHIRSVDARTLQWLSATTWREAFAINANSDWRRRFVFHHPITSGKIDPRP